MSTLGDLLKNTRGDRSLRDIAKLVGVSHTYLNLLEKGIDPRTKKPNQPSVDMIKRLSKAYGIDYNVLMSAAGYSVLENDNKSDIILSPEAQTLYNKILNMDADSDKESISILNSIVDTLNKNKKVKND